MLDLTYAFVCQLCELLVSYSGCSTNLMQHLRRHHNQAYTALLDESADDIASSSKQQKLDSFINNSASIICHPANSSTSKVITKQIAIMIAKDLQPFSVLEDYGFINLVKRLEPRYIIPTRKHIRHVVIDLYNEEKSNLQKILSKETFIHITTDLWTDTKTFLFYLGMTCHYIDKNMKMNSRNLVTKYFDCSHTALNIKKGIENALNDFGISEITSITTDNGANIVVATKAGGWLHFSCYAHTLNLVVTDSIKQTSELEEVLKKCPSIVHIFKSSSSAASILRTAQEHKGKCSKR